MVICPRCGIEHDMGKEFCKKCGAFLLTDKDLLPLKANLETQLICPVCEDFYNNGSYCKKCGSLLLFQGVPFHETAPQPLDKKLIKKQSKEWVKLGKEKKNLEVCLRNLDKQKDKISNDAFNPMFINYQNQLKELSFLHNKIELELDSVRRRTLEEITFLEKELKPIQKRLEEFRFLYKRAGITRTDFLREQQEMNGEIQSRVGKIKKCRQTLTLLPQEMRDSVVSKGFTEILFQPFPLLVVCGLIILVSTGGYFLYQRFFQPDKVVSKENVTPFSATSTSHNPQTMLSDLETERIKSLFETIKQANLQQNLDLFMTCFSRDFANREKKRAEALKTWNHFNYLSLSYDLKNQRISGDTAEVRLEWLIKSSEKVGGKLQENRVVLDAILKKEHGFWKIQEIKPAG